MLKPKFLLVPTPDGTCILKREGSDDSQEFEGVLEAIIAVRKLHEAADVTIYDPLGRVVLNTTV